MIVAYIDNARVVFDPEIDVSWEEDHFYLRIDESEYYVFEDSEQAGKAARDYWRDMAENDPEEFACIIGKENLIKWGLGKYAGPGSTQVQSLEEWLDLHLDAPEEHFAGYDGEEREFRCKHPDYGKYTVCYRYWR